VQVLVSVFVPSASSLSMISISQNPTIQGNNSYMDLPGIYSDFDEFFDLEPFYSDSSPVSITSTPSLDGWSSAQSPEMSAQEWPAQTTGEEEMLPSFARAEV
jgi:hypothetical protein